MWLASYFSRPFLWLALYLLILAVCASFYLNSVRQQTPLYLTDVNNWSATAQNVSVSLDGSSSDGLPAYLSLDAANTRAIVGNIPFVGDPVDVEILADKIYVLSRKGDVKIYYLNNATDPALSEIRKAMVAGFASDIGENFLSVSSVKSGTVIHPFGPSNTPYRIPGTSFASIHRGKNIFIASGKEGLSVVEFNWKTIRSRQLGVVNLPGITVDLAFMGDAVVVASRSGGLHVVDVSDVENPRLIQTIKGQKNYSSVWVLGDIVYASDADRQLDIFRQSDGRLTLSGSLPLNGKVTDYILDGERLYISEVSSGVGVLDISDPEQPRRIGFVGTPGHPGGLALYGDYLYVACSSQGVQIVDTRLIEPINVMASVNTPYTAFALVLDGQWIYIADYRGGLQVVDSSDPDDLKIVATLPTHKASMALVKAGDMVFMALAGNGILGIDVSNPLQPKLVNHFVPDVSVSDLAARDSTLFVSTFKKQLLKIDISDPWRPTVVASVDLPGRPLRIALAGEDVFVAAEKAGLLVVRFTPGQPGRLIGSLTRPWPMEDFSQALDIAVHGDIAYLVQGEQGLQIIDISQPKKPKEVALIPLPAQGLSIQLSETYAVVATRWKGYFFIDISRPGNPYLAANIRLPNGNKGFRVDEDRLYVPAHASGVNVVPLPVKDSVVAGSSEFSLIFEKPQFAGWYDLSVSSGKEFVRSDTVLRVD